MRKHALGYADIVAAIVGPLAQGGASAYSTYADSKTAKVEVKQRAAEVQQQAELYKAQIESAERQRVLEEVAALRRSQAMQSTLARYAPYAIGAFVLVGLGIAAASAVRRSS